MRIGLVIYGSLNSASGGYLYDRRLTEWLHRRGDQVEVISLPGGSYARKLLDNSSVALRRRLLGRRFDVLLQDELNHPSLFLMNRRLRQRAGYPIVSIVHHLRSSELRVGWQNALYRAVERAYLRSVDGYVFNSETTREVVSGLIGVARPHVVAPPGGDRLGSGIGGEELQERLKRNGPLRLIFVGNLIPRKGLHTLLAALTELHQKDWLLTIIGNPRVDRGYTRQVRDHALTPGLRDRIRFRGAISNAELTRELESSDVLVVPSSYEGFGITYLEGMAFGLPAIGSTSGAAREIISHGRNGFLVPPEDSKALSQCVGRLLEERAALLPALSAGARDRFEAHNTWDECAATIGELLDGVGAGRSV